MAVALHEHAVLLDPCDVRFPIELRAPAGFRPEDPRTWPRAEGRIELVGGRLLFMPPCGDVQQDVVSSVVHALCSWADSHPGFLVGSNDAGMMLGGDVRAADAAVWKRDQAGEHTGRYRRTPPVLAVEVAGQDEAEPELREKAQWYLSRGVTTVWIVLPTPREVLVISSAGESRHRSGEALPDIADLAELKPGVELFFAQLV